MILAAADTEWLVKLLIPAVVVASWIIGAIAQAAKKKPGAPKEKPWEEILRDLAGGQQKPAPPPMPPPQAPPMPRSTPKPLPKPTRQPSRSASKPPPAFRPKQQPKPPIVRPPARRGPIVQTPPPLPAPAKIIETSPQAAHFVHTDITATEIGSKSAASRPRQVSANASAIANWQKPGTLRQQWILTEVLQPPVGLRQ